MAKIDLIDNGWVDLVFEGKNQAYGAYQLSLVSLSLLPSSSQRFLLRTTLHHRMQPLRQM